MMTPAEVIKNALSEPLRTADGKPLRIDLQPGLSKEELASFEQQLPRPLSGEVRALLRFCSGFIFEPGFKFEPVGHVDFCQEENSALDEIFPASRYLLGDGEGNRWAIDVHPGSGEWGVVFFLCHDPPVVVIQAPTLAEFIGQIFDRGRPEQGGSAIDFVLREAVFRIWGDRSKLQSVENLRGEAIDAQLATFVSQLPDGWRIADLRRGGTGDGFAWGVYSSEPLLRRFDSELLFGIGRPGKRRWFGFGR